MKNPALFQVIRLLLLLCLVAPLSALAAPTPVATVVAIRGTVTAQGAGSTERALAIKSPVYQNDVLKTGSNGQLQIMFTDNSIISLGRGSEMKIAEYRWQAGQKDGTLKTQIKEGSFRVMGGALAKDAPQNFKTETPTATIGIRGSMYAGVTSADFLSVLFQGGKGIEVSNEYGTILITMPGFGSRVVLNAAPEAPHRFTTQELKKLNSQFNGNSQNSGGGSNGSDAGGGGARLPDPLVVQLVVPPPPPVPPVNEYRSAPGFGSPSSSPSDGIYLFDGGIGGVSTAIAPYTGTDTFVNSMSLGVNWYNKRLFGAAFDSQNDIPVFFFGSVNGTTVTDLTIFGIDHGYSNNSGPGWISGSGVGLFTGTNYDFFAFTASGTSANIIDGIAHDSWLVGGGGQQVPTNMTPVAPRGTENWQGFAVGTSLNFVNPYQSGAAFYQSAAGDFSLSVNKDLGTIGGTLTPGNELQDSTFTSISNLQIGGSTSNSVYLRDDLMAALITGGTPTLMSSGNLMVVAGPNEQFSSYCTWGYWGIAYNDPSDGSDRFMAVPFSFWIAGNPTPNSVIGNLASSNFVGEYNGQARGAQISGGGMTSLSGTSYLKANFNAGTVTGNITFPNVVTLQLGNGGGIAGNTFNADVSGTNLSGTANGMFFGPQANAVGGNFSAANSATSTRYLGVFGGNR